jgi:hypothetical protein
MFSDKHVERNALCRVFLNPSKEAIRKFRIEAFYKEVSILNKNAGDISMWNIMRHVNGVNPVKIGRRFFYDKK